MPPRLTDRQRRLRAAQEIIKERMTSAVLVELQRLWRDIYGGLRRLDKQRGKYIQKADIRKAYTIHQDMWETFKQRLRTRLAEEIKAGAIDLALVNFNWFNERFGDTLAIDSGQIAAGFETHIADMVRRIADSTRLKIGRQTVAWYQRPGSTLDDLIHEISARDHFGRSRAESIAETSITDLNGRVEMEIGNRLGIHEYTWLTRRDQSVCIKPVTGPDGKRYDGCKGLHGQVFRRDTQPFRAGHPRCRCNPSLRIATYRAAKTKKEPEPLVDLSGVVNA